MAVQFFGINGNVDVIKSPRKRFYLYMKTANDNDSYGHIVKYTGLFGGVQGLSILINLVRNKMVAVLLGPVGMGLASLFNTSLNFVSQATNLGLSFSAVRHLSEIFDEGDMAKMSHYVRVVRCWGLITALVGMFVLAMAGPWLSANIFPWGDHTLHFIVLSPVVAMMALTGCETAILKGARRLRPLASIQVGTIVIALVVSVPIYWLFGMSGIVPVLFICAFATMVLTMRSSFHLFPYRLFGDGKKTLAEGGEMVRLGVSFVMAGILGSGAEMVVRSFLNLSGDLDAVGLYNAGYMLTVTYAGMVFSAMETDYFPRLSAINHDNTAVIGLANRQIEVSVLAVGPMLSGLIVFLPVLMPLLYSGKFLPVVAMAQVTVFSMYFKAVLLPLAYITLAKGDSLAYLVLEAIYDVIFVVLVIVGYQRWGLFGTGVALSVAHLCDLLTVSTYAHFKYGYKPTAAVLRYMAMQYAFGAAAYAVTCFLSSWNYWVVGVVVVGVSAATSLYIIIYKKTSLWEAMKRKYLSR